MYSVSWKAPILTTASWRRTGASSHPSLSSSPSPCRTARPSVRSPALLARAPARARGTTKSRSRPRATRRASRPPPPPGRCRDDKTPRSCPRRTLRRPSLRSGGSGASGAACAAPARAGQACRWSGRLPWPWRSVSGLTGGGRSLHLLPRVVARAHQRAGFYVTIAHLEAVAAERGELVGRVISRDREMLARGTDVLADVQDLHVLREHAQHRHPQLIQNLPQPATDHRLRGRA